MDDDIVNTSKNYEVKRMTDITIDGKEYDLESLSDNARSQLNSLRIVDQKIAQLQSDLAITQTARNSYAQALKAELPED